MTSEEANQWLDVFLQKGDQFIQLFKVREEPPTSYRDLRIKKTLLPIFTYSIKEEKIKNRVLSEIQTANEILRLHFTDLKDIIFKLNSLDNVSAQKYISRLNAYSNKIFEHLEAQNIIKDLNTIEDSQIKHLLFDTLIKHPSFTNLFIDHQTDDYNNPVIDAQGLSSFLDDIKNQPELFTSETIKKLESIFTANMARTNKNF